MITSFHSDSPQSIGLKGIRLYPNKPWMSGHFSQRVAETSMIIFIKRPNFFFKAAFIGLGFSPPSIG
jgi:hypothetical protein